MSSEPPLTGGSVGAPRGFSLSARPFWSPPTSFCTAFANVCSSGVQVGSPTLSMLACIASAIGLLKWRGAAVPTIRRLTVVSVIAAAASAILFPSA